MNKDFFEQQAMTLPILWGAFFTSHFVFAYLVWSGMLSGGSYDPNGPTEWHLFSAIASGMAIISFVLFRYVNSVERAKKLYQRAPTNFSVQFMLVDSMNKFQDLPDEDKKRYFLFADIQTKTILAYALAESVNIFGICNLFLNMKTEYYYYFFAAGILLMGTMFPKAKEIVKNVR